MLQQQPQQQPQNESSSNSISNIGVTTLGQKHQMEPHLKKVLVSVLALGVGLSTLGEVGVNLGKAHSRIEALRDIALEVVKVVGICH